MYVWFCFVPSTNLETQDAKLRKWDAIKEFVDPMPINCLKNKRFNKNQILHYLFIHL